jgi:hypothetical protein
MVAERWVAWTSGACAVHCAAVPLLAAAGPWLAWGEVVEAAVLVALLPLVGWQAVHGGRRHGRWRVLLPVAAGATLWLAALAGVAEGGAAALLIGAGGAAMFIGLRRNARLAATCRAGCCTG